METFTRDDLVTFATALSRLMMAREMGQTAYGGNRDYYAALGYPEAITIEDYAQRYRRQDIAGRVIDLPAQDTWKKPPRVSTGEDDSEFDRAWDTLVDRLQIWNYLSRADKLSGIGHFGILLMGVKDGKPLSEPVEQGAAKPPDGLLYLRPFSEEKVVIKKWEEKTDSARYGLPLSYEIQVEEKRKTTVHWSRVLHLAEGKRDSEWEGTPRLERVFNRLDDLIKLIGGGSEAAWLNMRPGTLLTTKEGYKLDKSDQARSDREEEIFRYAHDILRMITLEGMEAQQMGTSSVPDITPQFEACIGLIAAASGIPQRVLLGSAKGELAAAEYDLKQWAGEIVYRQKNYAEPEILRIFISRLQWYGILPLTPNGYHIGTPGPDGQYLWPLLIEMSQNELAEIMDRKAGAVQKMTSPLTGELPLTEGEIRLILGHPARPPEDEMTGDLASEFMSLMRTNASHKAVLINHICPLCGADAAYHYEGHGGLLVCAGCNKTYDPEVE